MRDFLKTDAGICLMITLAWQLIMTGIGWAASIAFTTHPAANVSVLDHTMQWDAGWYQNVLGGGYAHTPGVGVFYPLFPLTVWLLNHASLGVINFPLAGLIVNTVAIWLALVALLKIAKKLIGGSISWWVVALFIASPAAMFLHGFYSEALYCALGFWAYSFALNRRWGLMALMLAMLTSVHLPSILFIGLCGLEFWRAHDWKIKQALNRQAWWFLLAPAGFVAYAIYLFFVRGDALAMFHGYHEVTDWSYHVFNPVFLYTVARYSFGALYILFTPGEFNNARIINVFLPVIAWWLLFGTSLYATLSKKNRQLLPLGIFGLVASVFFTLNSNVVSIHRYALPCLVLFLAPVALIKHKPGWKPALYVALYLSTLMQAYLLVLFSSGRFAG